MGRDAQVRHRRRRVPAAVRAPPDAWLAGSSRLVRMPTPLWAPWRLEYVQQADEDDRACIFCEPDEELVLHRGDRAFALLNRFPYASGHLMVAPLRHVGSYGDLTDDEALEIHRLARAGIEALTATYSPQGHNLGWNLGR